MTRPPAEITEALTAKIEQTRRIRNTFWSIDGSMGEFDNWLIEELSELEASLSVAAAPAPASPAVRDDLCPDCGHHLHRPNPGRCQWRDCQCGCSTGQMRYAAETHRNPPGSDSPEQDR